MRQSSLLNDTWRNPLVDSWVAERKVENFGGDKHLLARHPYDATYLFDTGIWPLSDYGFKGVIWYQGESNAERVSLHKRLFELLIQDWRHHFHNEQMPFYYVQLSSIERENWGAFRDTQRRLLYIPYTGMAVSSDVGHPTNVHPKRKWVVGSRLAAIALAKTYGQEIEYSGPLFDYVNVDENKLEVHFTHANGLRTSDRGKVKDIWIAGADKEFVKARAKIRQDKLIVWSTEIPSPRFVRYGYSSFTEGNLINGSCFPASTFSNEYCIF